VPEPQKYETETGYERLLLPALALMLFIAMREWASSFVEAKQFESVRNSEAQRKRIFSISPAMIAITRGSDGVFLDVNEAYSTITGYRPDELIGKSSTRPGLWHNPHERDQLIARLLSETTVRGIDIKICTKSGETRDVLASFSPIRIAGDDCLIGVALDVTERHRNDAEMRNLSRTLEQTADTVMITDKAGTIEYVNRAFEKITGYSTLDAIGRTPNILRRLTLEHLGKALATARAHDRLVAVLFLDIDRFKNINDTLGHDAGDMLLQELGGRLHRHLRTYDSIARFGGDEFVIVMNEIESHNDAAQFAPRRRAQRIHPPPSATDQPTQWGNRRLRGAVTLAAPRKRPRITTRIHPVIGRNRHDLDGGKLAAGNRLQTTRVVAQEGSQRHNHGH
jgi:diguanylate cyclase (GGDEF)-like protein/PAS domain S-box-containing protein